MGPHSQHFIFLITFEWKISVTLRKAGKACQGQTFSLLGLNEVLTFTALHFLHNYQMPL